MNDHKSSPGRFAKDPSIVERKIAGEVILVPVRESVGDLECIFALNEVAARIWELIDGKRSLGEIRDAIVEEFDVEPGTVETDLHEFLEQLQGEGAVRVA